MRLWTMLAIVMWAGIALAQNSFPTPGGATVGSTVVMCIAGGVARPCQGTVTSGPDSSFTTPGGQRTGGSVRMCVNAGVATPC